MEVTQYTDFFAKLYYLFVHVLYSFMFQRNIGVQF